MISKTFIRYCKKCTIPDTIPDTPFDANGVCAGCNYYNYRENVDWKKREQALIELLGKYKSKKV